MIDHSKNIPGLNRISGAGLGRLALVVGAAWAMSGAAATPASALDTGWKQACTFAISPQGYGDMIKERNCIEQKYCQAMADAQGSPYTGAGCIMVRPSTEIVERTGPRPTYTRR